MATKYNDNPVNRMYTRAHTVTVNFPHENEGLPPSIHFYEHNVIEKTDGTEQPLPETTGQAHLEVPPETMATEFPLWDMVAEEPIEGATGTYGQLATLLYSLYFHVAEKRDAWVAEEQAKVAGDTHDNDAGMPF